MKQTVYFYFIFTLFVTGRDLRPVSEKLAHIDSLFTNEQNDSAYRMLLSIHEGQISNEADRAYYYLLMTRGSYLIKKPLESDSLLDVAITYYKNHEDKVKLTDCYYYKAAGFHRKADYQQSMLYNKKAEKLANDVGNIHQQYKIAEIISLQNYLSNNYLLSLDYARKSLTLAKESKRTEYLPYACYRIGAAYLALDKKDSAYYYFSKAEPYIKYVRKAERPYILSNLSLVYLDSNPDKAKRLLQEALSLKELANLLDQLAYIHYNEGQKEEAYRLWEQALTINDRDPKDNIIHNLLEYDVQQGKTDKVCQRVNDIIAIKDSIISTLKNDTIRELQTRFDHQVELNAANKRLINWQWILGAVIFVFICLIVSILIKHYKTWIKLQKRQLEINNFMTKVEELESRRKLAETQLERLKNNQESHIKEIDELTNQRDESEREIELLLAERELWTLQEVAKIRKGCLLYDDVTKGKSVRNWPNDDFEAFIAYYDAIKHNSIKNIEKKYKNLTTYNMFYLLLVDMGKSKDEICAMLAISRDSLRSIDHRIKMKSNDK